MRSESLCQKAKSDEPWTILHNKLPPTLESRTCSAEAASPSSHSSFCEEVFSRVVAAAVCRGVSGHGDRAPWLRHTNEANRSNILAPGFRSGKLPDLPFSRLHRLLWRQPYRLHNRSFAGGTACSYNDWLLGNCIQLQQRNCSGFAPDFSRRSTDQARKELPRAIPACAKPLKIYLFSRVPFAVFPMPASQANLNLLITGGAGFIGSNLVLELQERFPNSRLTVIDDFRSGDFKNLAGYRGDFVAANLAELSWREQFGDEKFDAIFHLASITDTTNHDQFEQV